MYDLYEKTCELFEEYAKSSESYLLLNRKFQRCLVVKENRVLSYEFPNRDETSKFIMSEPLLLEKEIEFQISPNAKFLSMKNLSSQLYHLDEIKDFHVRYDNKKQTQELVFKLFNDFEFKETLIKHLYKDFFLCFENKTLTVGAYYNVDAMFAKNMNVDKLLDMASLLDEAKKALLFHEKRMNDFNLKY